MRDDQKDNRVYFLHIQEEIERIREFTAEGHTAFLTTPLVQNAVVYNLTVIGEAARQVSVWLKEKHPEVPWRDIIGTRNKVVHEYFRIDLDAVWDVVQNDLPQLSQQAVTILAELEEPQP